MFLLAIHQTAVLISSCLEAGEGRKNFSYFQLNQASTVKIVYSMTSKVLNKKWAELAKQAMSTRLGRFFLPCLAYKPIGPISVISSEVLAARIQWGIRFYCSKSQTDFTLQMLIMPTQTSENDFTNCRNDHLYLFSNLYHLIFGIS